MSEEQSNEENTQEGYDLKDFQELILDVSTILCSYDGTDHNLAFALLSKFVELNKEKDLTAPTRELVERSIFQIY